jgi:CTD small phosphatase-like protein 2
VFTASQSTYANAIIDYLDPQKKFISHRLFRDSCTLSDLGFYVKDLRIINRDLSKVVIIDNIATSYAY